MTTPNMGLTVPTATVTVGPDYANEVNGDLTLIDGHDHTGGGTGGKQLGAAALLIDGDVAMNNHNLGSVRSVRLQDQGATLSGGSDIRSVYANGPDLYYNNDAGVAIKITSGGALNTGVTNTVLNGHAISTGTTILAADPYTLYQIDTTSNTVSVVLPLASAVGRGRWYVFVDINGTTPTHSFSVQRSGADTIDGSSVMSVLDAYSGLLLFSDGTSKWTAHRLPASTLTLTQLTATIAKLGGAQPATTGDLRLNATCAIKARNAGNSADIVVAAVDGADNVTVGDATATASATLTCKAAGTVTCSVASGASVSIGSTGVVLAGSGTCTVGSGSAFATLIGTTCNLAPGNGTAMVTCNATGVAFYGGTPVAQQTRAGQLTDSTAGTPGSTLAAVVGTTYSTDVPTLRNWAASLAQRVNALETIIHNLRLST